MIRDTFDRFQPTDRGLFGENEEAPAHRARAPRVNGASDLHDLTLLHHDRDFDVIAGVTGQPTRWYGSDRPARITMQRAHHRGAGLPQAPRLPHPHRPRPGSKSQPRSELA